MMTFFLVLLKHTQREREGEREGGRERESKRGEKGGKEEEVRRGGEGREGEGRGEERDRECYSVM